jgi:hypothetical protein
MTSRLFFMLFVCLLWVIGASAADDVFTKGKPDRIAPRSYPITELRLTQEPGNYHFIRTNNGDFVLSDYWWKEIQVGDRAYTEPLPPVPPPAPFPQPLPPGQGTGPRPGPGNQDLSQLKKVYVELVKGKGYEFFSRERIKPISFTLVENFPREIVVRFGNSKKTLVAMFDGYHVELGLERPAKVIPRFNAAYQDLGDGQGLEDVLAVVYWEEDDQGRARNYKSKEDSRGIQPENIDAWGQDLKSRIFSQKGISEPIVAPQQ